ncbi:hypothetical protein N7495_001086 [Penicillium taxi]|uniref:uncharacterized protein n=1 Tax=Penicillium taxi TaxID=168475 RepID=UPI002544F54D|nr:uncharacterized protein N7495_001086 [Penicillium taxi]KAJ5908404.1 hypothetical protein N7495_001086 [Penicillium taxi]
MPETAWEKTKRLSKKGFDKTWATVDLLGAPVNRLSNKLGAEAFWPMTIDKESDKAARILRSFCTDGFYSPDDGIYTDENGKINRPKGNQRNAKGICIFTTMRTGLWVSGSGGSGVLLARIPETGEWSPPSGIMLHTAGIGFLAGIDIYDCVVIINTYKALEAFKKVRCTLGGEVSVAAGPVGLGGTMDSELHARQAPIWTYMKSKGLYAGVAVDGTIIIERTDENERFYGERISVQDILAGKVRHPPYEIKTLIQTIKAAQGDRDVDESLLPPAGEAPGDIELIHETHFGVPEPDDPDPYGVKALEAEGTFIREAGTKVRPSHEAFEFRPHPSSPLYSTFPRRSIDSSTPNSWRASIQSHTSVDRGTQTTDIPLPSGSSLSRASSRSVSVKETVTDRLENLGKAPIEEDKVPVYNGEEKEGDVDIKEPVPVPDVEAVDKDVHVCDVVVAKPESRAVTPVEDSGMSDDSKRNSPTFTRARLVTIPKRPTPPPLPPRHPGHTWVSTSSRESTSPTALSQSSRSTEPTEATAEAILEPTFSSAPLPSNVKTLQTNVVLPAVVDEDDLLYSDSDSDSELPVDKDDEFHSVNGDEETTTQVATEDITPHNIEDEKTADMESIALTESKPASIKSIVEDDSHSELLSLSQELEAKSEALNAEIAANSKPENHVFV